MFLNELYISFSRYPFDDQTQYEKCGVVVDLFIARVEVERPSTEQFHQFLARFFEHLEFSKSRKLRIPLDSGRVIQEMPNRDVIALCRVAGKKLRHLVRERKLSLFGQKKDRCSGKLLRDGTDFVCGARRRWGIQIEIGQAVALPHYGCVS